jgi:hypothetical protein
LVRADDALYRAKRSGKDTIICDPPFYPDITDHRYSAA